MLKTTLSVAACALMVTACGSPPRPATVVAPVLPAPLPAPVADPALAAVPSTGTTLADSAATQRKVSLATNPKAYRVDGARHLYTVFAGQIYKGKLPPLVHAVVVTETELDAAGNVRDIQMVRVPSHAPEVVVKVREMIRAASPLPAPTRMGGTRYTDIWLVDKSGRWQLDTLTEGQL